MDVWRAMIRAQGGDPVAALPVAKETEVVTAETDGVLPTLDALAVGVAAWRLGAGRAPRTTRSRPVRGSSYTPSPGDRVRAGQPLLTLHTDTPERFERARQALEGAITIAESAAAAVEPADPRPDRLKGVCSDAGRERLWCRGRDLDSHPRIGVEQTVDVRFDQGLPGGLDDVLADPDRGPAAATVGGLDQHAYGRVRAVALVEDPHPVVDQVEPLHQRIGRRPAPAAGHGPGR